MAAYPINSRRLPLRPNQRATTGRHDRQPRRQASKRATGIQHHAVPCQGPCAPGIRHQAGMVACSSANPGLRSVPMPSTCPRRQPVPWAPDQGGKISGNVPIAVSSERKHSVRRRPNASALKVMKTVPRADPASPAAITSPMAWTNTPRDKEKRQDHAQQANAEGTQPRGK